MPITIKQATIKFKESGNNKPYYPINAITGTTDPTLTLEGAAAEAKATGDKIKQLSNIPKAISVTPIYQGDWVTPRLPSSCAIVGDEAYLFDGWLYNKEETHTNVVPVHIYNMKTNQHVRTIEIEGGHSNSAAYDGEHENFWVVPTLNYEAGVSAYYLYKYNKGFTKGTKVLTPAFNANGISYDWVTHKLYALAGTHKIYLIEEDENGENTITQITNQIQIPRTDIVFNQDFCVWNNRFYISTPDGIVASGMLTENPVVDSWYCIDSIDQSGRWKLGQSQGFEFSQDGQLYCVRISYIGGLNNGFLTVLPLNNEVMPNKTTTWIANRALSVFNYRQDNPFYLMQDEIRHINQLCTMLDPARRINIVGNENKDPVALGAVYTKTDCAICYSCPISFTGLNVEGGIFTLFPQQESNGPIPYFHLDGTTNINISRTGQLVLWGRSAMYTTNSKININTSVWSPLIQIRSLTRNPFTNSWLPLYINNVQIYSTGLYIGTASRHVADRFIQKGKFELTVTNNQVSTFQVNLSNEYSRYADPPLIFLTIYSESENTADIADISYWISSRTYNSFTVSARGNGNMSSAQTVYFMWQTIDEV